MEHLVGGPVASWNSPIGSRQRSLVQLLPNNITFATVNICITPISALKKKIYQGVRIDKICPQTALIKISALHLQGYTVHVYLLSIHFEQIRTDKKS
jgi:hypothetical protein